MRNFDQEQAERTTVDKETLAFILGGVKLYRNPEPPADALFVLSNVTKDSSSGEDLKAVSDVVLGMVLPECKDAYMEALRHGTPQPSIRTLMDVMNWMIEESTGRPPTQASTSTNGAPETGTTSTPPAGSEASTAASFGSEVGST
jgi:hypothetical protein